MITSPAIAVSTIYPRCLLSETDRAIEILSAVFSGVELLVEFKLVCGHSRLFNLPHPGKKDIVFCQKCDDYTVAGYAVVQFDGKCLDCKWKMTGRSTYGNPETRAKALGKTHHTKTGHTVVVKCHDATVATFSRESPPELDLGPHGG